MHMVYLEVFFKCSFWFINFGVELEMLHFWAATEIWHVGKYLTTGSGTRGQKGICQFPWCVYPHPHLFQPTNMMSPNVELEKDMYNWFFQAYTYLLGGAQCFWPKDLTLKKRSLVQWFSTLAACENYLQEFLKVRKEKGRKQVPAKSNPHIQQIFEDTMAKWSELLYIFPSSFRFLLVFPSTLSLQVPRASYPAPRFADKYWLSFFF